MGLLRRAVRIYYGGPNASHFGGPCARVTRAGITPVDFIESRLNVLPFAGCDRVKKPRHVDRELNLVPPGQSLRVLPPRTRELSKFLRHHFFRRWHSHRLKTRETPAFGRRLDAAGNIWHTGGRYIRDLWSQAMGIPPAQGENAKDKQYCKARKERQT